MKKRVIALMLAFVLVLNMGTVAFATGEGTPVPNPETEPTPTQEVEATLTPAPIAEAPSPVAEVIPTPTSEVVLESISVTQTPDKLEYLCTDTVVDSTGGLLTLTFSDRTTQTVDLSAATLSLVKENTNTASVNVAYEGMTDSFAVTVTHNYDEGTVTTEATATEPGVMTYTCADCGDEQTGELPMVASTEIASGTCGAEGDNLTWTLNEDGVLTITGTGMMADYTDSNGECDSPWYIYRESINSIVIDGNITCIGNYAFYGCSKITNIAINSQIGPVGDYAFYGCSSLTSIVLPENVWRIGCYAFSGCNGLTSITMPASVRIYSEAFDGCSSITNATLTKGTGVVSDYTDNRSASVNYYGWTPWLESKQSSIMVTIGDEITHIGKNAFYHCDNLADLIMPASVSFGIQAFSGCTGIKNVLLTKGTGVMPYYGYTGDTQYSSTPWNVSKQSGITVTIEDGVTNIGENAFKYCDSLSSIFIPDSVKTIDTYAFYGCTELVNISMSGVTNIGEEAFFNCYKLTSILLPDSLTNIGEKAFSDCSKLTSITMPASARIREDAFNNCTNISNVTLTRGTGEMLRYTTGTSSGELRNISSYQWTPWYESEQNNITVTIEDGINNIGKQAFYRCDGLTSISIPRSITSIGEEAFYNCSDLTAVHIDNLDCWVNISFHGSYTNPLTYAHNLYLDNMLVTDVSFPDGIAMVGNYTFAGATCIKTVSLPDSVASIADYAFGGCSGLTSITMPVSASIGGYAFSGCTNITVVTLTKGTGVMVNYSKSSYSDTPWYISRNNNISVTIEDGVTSIGSYAFYGCSGLTSIELPEGLTSIGDYAFRDCSGLTSIELPEGLTSISDYAFRGCSGLTSIDIPDGVTSIGSCVFEGCTKLTSITMPASASISASAFYGCTGVTSVTLTKGTGTMTDYGISGYKHTPWYVGRNNNISVTIEDGVTNIGKYAFYGCTGLTSITIPDKVASIGDLAFQDCSGLTEITFKGDAPTIADDAFTNVTATAKYLHMKNWPEDALENYGGTLTWQICCENFEECEIVTDEAVAPTFDSTGLTEGSHCSVCEKPIVAQNELPKLAVTELEITAPDKLVYYKGESLDSTGLTVTAKLNNDTNIDVTDQVQLEGFSSNAAGTKTITVSFKDAQATFDVQVFSFTSVSLSLEGRVIINFYANFPDYAEAGYTPGILFFRKQPDGDEIVAAYNAGEGVTSYVVADNGALMFSYDKLAAKELNDKVYATLYAVQDDGKVVFGTPTPISAAEYAISTFGLYANDARLQTLMVDMLNFGAAAQNEFDYRTDALANSNMSATMAAKATKDNVSLSNGMKLYKDGLSSDKVTIKSASLSLDNEISINFYAEIKGDIKKAELLIFDEYTAGGVYDKNTASKRTDMVPHEDMYAGFITGIAAKSMRDLYYARVYVQFEDGTEAYSGIGQYSVESYAWQVRNGSGFSSKLKLLMEEMMKYGDSAKMYMENKNTNTNG